MIDDDYNDRRQVEKRYKEAADELREAIKGRKASWASFDLGDLSDDPIGLDDSQFKQKINAVLLSRKMSIKDRNGWSKFIHAVECVFTALSPLTKNLLHASAGAQSVISLLLVNLYSNRFVDTFDEPLWCSMQWPPTLDNSTSVN